MSRLERAFFARDTRTVARHLLGCLLVRELGGQRLVGRVVEVEAYTGWGDMASHGHRGRTPRNAVMFGEVGFSYVYFIYGKYWLLNVVAKPPGVDYPAAVLIRALEPLEGVEVMEQHRGTRRWRDLLRGPGRLCQALQIDRALDGADVCTQTSGLWVEMDAPVPDEEVVTTPRINVRDDARPWRFAIRHHPCVSGPTRVNGVPQTIQVLSM